jgi:uncharacterized protein
MTERVESRLELLDAELERFVKIASDEFGAEQIILFGSLAQDRASASEWTDLDLVVIAETDLPFHRRIGELLTRARFRVGADVFVYTPAEWERMKTQRPFVREEIVTKGKVVYERAG